MKFAFVFPGQGSQSCGMLNEMAEQDILVKETFSEASDILGHDLWHLSQQGPEEKLNQTEWTQPVILTASVALWRIWQAWELPQPALLAGHSLGEYTALVCAGSLNFAEAVKLVHYRGQFMQDSVAVGEGAMAAILGLDAVQIDEICQEEAQGDILAAANFNAPGQTVIAGNQAAVKRACARLLEKGARRAITLPVSVPSHCQLMQPAAERLSDLLKEVHLSSPTIPVLNNIEAKAECNPLIISQNLVEQLIKPVQWIKTIESMSQQGIKAVFECGPGSVLTGLNKRIISDLTYASLSTPDQLALVTNLLEID